MSILDGASGRRGEETDMISAEMENIIVNLIYDAGSAWSNAMRAIRLAKEGSFAKAGEYLESASLQLVKAHHTHTDLIQQAERGETVELNLFLVHAQDHIMTATLAKEMAAEIVELHQAL